jgi:hypothetical protein
LVAKSEKTNGRIILQNDFKKSKKIEEAQDYDDRWDKQNEPRLLSRAGSTISRILGQATRKGPLK